MFCCIGCKIVNSLLYSNSPAHPRGVHGSMRDACYILADGWEIWRTDGSNGQLKILEHKRKERVPSSGELTDYNRTKFSTCPKKTHLNHSVIALYLNRTISPHVRCDWCGYWGTLKISWHIALRVRPTQWQIYTRNVLLHSATFSYQKRAVANKIAERHTTGCRGQPWKFLIEMERRLLAGYNVTCHKRYHLSIASYLLVCPLKIIE